MKFNELFDNMISEKKILSAKIADQFSVDIEGLYAAKDIDAIVKEMLPDKGLQEEYKSDLSQQIYNLIIKVGDEYTKKQAKLK